MRMTWLLVLAGVTLGLLRPVPAGAIGFIDSPTVYCRKVKSNDCLINVGYASVGAAPNHVVDMWVFVDNALVFHANGFFQTSMYVDNSFFGEGFPVKCGNPGATPPPSGVSFPVTYGSSYPVTIRARDTAGQNAANFATVVCPAK